MNPAHVHLILNHVPVIGAGFALFVLVLAAVWKSRDLQRLGYLALVLIALFTVPTFLSGEPGEEKVEHLPGVTDRFIDAHEATARIALAGIEVAGALALFGLLAFRSKPIPGWFATTALILTLLASGLMARTANLGGQIRHTEIRSGPDSTAVQGEAGEKPETGEQD